MKHREEREELAVTGEQLFVWAESALISELQPPSREPLCKQYRNPGPGTASPSLFSNSSWGRFSSPYTSFNAGMTFVQQSSIWWWKSFSVESNSSITLDLCCRTEELGGGGREGGEGGAGGRDCVSTTTSCWAAEIGMEDKLHSRILWPNLAYFYYCIARNFKGENFREFRSFVAIRESFLCKIWGHGLLWHSTSEQFSLRKSYFSQTVKSFLPWNFPTFTTISEPI